MILGVRVGVGVQKISILKKKSSKIMSNAYIQLWIFCFAGEISVSKAGKAAEIWKGNYLI